MINIKRSFKKVASKISTFIIVILIGYRLQNEILDEIQPNRLNSKWGFPYFGRSYNRKSQNEVLRR